MSRSVIPSARRVVIPSAARGLVIPSGARDLLFVVALLFGASTLAAQPQGSQPVRYGITKSRDTVTVGEPFEVRVRIRAPADAAIVFPLGPDSTGAVQTRDPRSIVSHDTIQFRDQTAVYHVAAWDIGAQRIQLDDAVVVWRTRAYSGQQRVRLDGAQVFVRTVLPADTTLRVPKPARPIWEVNAFPWWIVALALLVLALVLWWWWRKRRAGRKAEPIVHVDPYIRAVREFDRIEALGLIDAGERTRFVTLAVEVLRDYLAARYPEALLALTSRELLVAMRRRPGVQPDALSRALHEADLAKFAGVGLTEERARALSAETRAIVERDHAASVAQSKAA
jgi:hypothetical protein